MSLLTPSRLAILIVSFAFISFFWTFGLPNQLGQPALPALDHYDHQNVHIDPLKPTPIKDTHTSGPKPTQHGERPAEEDVHRWADATTMAGKLKPTTTGIAEFEEDGGRWDDKDMLKSGDTTAPKWSTSADSPTSFLTEVVLMPTGAAVTNFTSAHIHNPGPSTHEVDASCRDVHMASEVMVVFRTSKAELASKLPTHLQGLISCVPNFAIFSDHADEIEGYTVHDALDSIGSEARRTHDEFREYRIMHADADHKPDPKKTKDLDKWKWLPMVYKAYHLNPSTRWVIFIEADTSLSWTNLLQWVGRLDYRIPYYSGAPTFLNGVQIGQRGSGVLLSQGALRRYVKSYDELYSSNWEQRVGKECCGDLLLSMAMNDAHVEFYAAWPLLQGEQPNTLDFSKKQWCVPAVTWHHVNGEDLAAMWESEKRWTQTHGWQKPYMFCDAFEEHFEPHLETLKDHWDNLSQDTKIVAPQGRQQQHLREEEERRKKHKKEQQRKEEEERRKKQQEEEEEEQAANDRLAAEKQEAEASLRDALELEQSKSEEASFKKKQRRDKKGRPSWDKLAETYKQAGDSSESCQRTCQQVDDCLQWRYTTKGDGECHLAKVLRLGKKTNGGDKWTSGWIVDRVHNVTKSWECKEPKWKFYQ